MGTYINPGNQAFRRIDGPSYVDKTGMIRLINERIGGDDSLYVLAGLVVLGNPMQQRC